MFEKIAISLLNEIHENSRGSLQCLPYSRALLDALSILEKNARPLVIRGVVFGKQEENNNYRRVGAKALIDTALNSAHANGTIELRSRDADAATIMRFPYRTIGLPHNGDPGDKTLGNFAPDGGAWLGHLGVIIDDTMIDLTLGQLNDNRFNIDFNPPALTVPVTEAFLTGDERLTFIVDGMLVSYQAYPNERTFEASKSWTDPTFRGELEAVGERTAAHYKGKPDSELHDSNR